jgi:hypothetical protein
LTATAKSWGVTLNDLLLGLLMKAIGLVASHRQYKKGSWAGSGAGIWRVSRLVFRDS